MFEPTPKEPLGRRAFIYGAASLIGGGALLVESGLFTGLKVLAGVSYVTKPGTVSLVEFDDQGKRLGVVNAAKIVKTDAEWRKQLSPLSFEVLRQGATETAFTGPLNDNYKPGIYRCLACQTALFSSSTKYDPHEGWPSFWAPLAHRNLLERQDWSEGMDRTEVRCRRCESHLGHLFNDGPAPTGLRYCMDSAALSFRLRPA